LEPFYNIGTIAVLTPSRLRGQMQQPTGVNVRGEPGEHSGALRLVQARRIVDIKEQFHLRGGAIDMLPARPATATELKVQFGWGDSHCVRNVQVSIKRHTHPPPQFPGPDLPQDAQEATCPYNQLFSNKNGDQ
jgi:hypothetical protein